MLSGLNCSLHVKADPTDLRALETSQAAANEERQRARQIEIDDFRWLMKSKQGRRFVWRMLEQAGMFRTSFSMNGLEMAKNEGQRNVGIMLMAEITTTCPEQYFVMIKEHQEHAERRTAKRST